MRAIQYLLASVAFASLGASWIFIILLWKYSWLLQVLAFATSTMVLFAISAMFFIGFIARLMLQCQDGLIEFLPRSVAELLDQSIFELLHLINKKLILPLFDWLRLVLIVGFELSEDDRSQILGEMDRDFRDNVFARPALRTLPVPAQRILLGRKWTPAAGLRNVDPHAVSGGRHRTTSSSSAVSNAVLEDVPEDGPINSGGSREERGVRRVTRHNSIDQLQDLLRRAEDASRTSLESRVVQKVLTEKFSDQAAFVIRGTASHQYDTIVPVIGDAVAAVTRTVTTPPQRLTLRVPWEICRINIKVASAVWCTVFGSSESEPSPDANAAASAGSAQKTD